MTPEERIKAAAEALSKAIGQDEASDLAEVALTAAYPEDFLPKPKWRAAIAEKLYRNANYGTSFCTDAEQKAQSYNAGVDDALEAVGPIIETAVAYAHHSLSQTRVRDGSRTEESYDLIRAIDEAGL